MNRLDRRELIACALTLLACAPLMWAPVGNFDTWFHLANGRLILATGKIPTTDVFSFTAAGAPVVSHEWLWEIAAWQCWKACGPWGLQAFRAAQISVGLCAVWFSARGLGALRLPLALATVLGALGAICRFSDRPQVFTFACFGLLMFLLGRHRLGSAWPLRLAALPLFALWANAHAGVVLGLALIGYSAAAALLGSARRRALELGAIGVAVLALIAWVTPVGLRELAYPWIVAQADASLHLGELDSVVHSLTDFEGTLALILLVAASAAATARLRREREDALLALILAGLAAWHVRAIDLAALTAIPMIALAIEPIFREPRRARAAGLAGAACLGLLAALEFQIDRDARPRIGVSPGVPASATQFVATHFKGEQGFNSYELGGYLLFADPTHRVFYDSRNDPYLKLFAKLRAGGDPFALAHMDYAVVLHDELYRSQVPARMRLVFFDDAAQVLADDRDLRTYQCLLPEGPFLAAGAPLAGCAAESERALRECTGWRADVLAAEVAQRTGDIMRRDELLFAASTVANAPPRTTLAELVEFDRALSAAGSQRSLELSALAQSTGVHSLALLARLAIGDRTGCEAWSRLAAEPGEPRAWSGAGRSPVLAVWRHTCARP